VLYLQSTSEIGGSDVSLLRIVEGLDKSRFHPAVALPSDGPLVEKLRQQGCDVFIVDEMIKLTTRKGYSYWLRYLANYPKAVWKIRSLIKRERVDLIHTNTLHNLYGLPAAKLAGRPHLWHVREIVLQSKWVRSVELFLARRFSDRVIVTSDAVGEMFVNGKRPLPANVRKISNSIDTESYHPRNDGSGIYGDLNIAKGTPLVGTVCRLDHWKGVDTFLQAAAVCKKEFPHARYLVAGGAIEGREEYAGAMKRLADELGLSDVVYFTGWRYQPEDMPRVHAALSILVLASSWPEPFGLVLLEAMATGKPVVATNHGGPKEICLDGETARLVPPQDPEQMAVAILELLRNPARAREMGAAGRKRVEQLFNRNRCIKTLESLYTEVLSG
jgi:glycosyltransferase involved in cell wall biosynthesis